MALLAADRTLLERCLAHQSGSWNDFVDRFLGLIYHVVRHTAHLRSLSLLPEDIEDVAAEILQRIAANDYAVLRHFRQQSSLAAYLAVIARRICITELVRRAPLRRQHTRRKPGPGPGDRPNHRQTRTWDWRNSKRCNGSCGNYPRANGKSCASTIWKDAATRRSAPYSAFPSAASVPYLPEHGSD